MSSPFDSEQLLWSSVITEILGCIQKILSRKKGHNFVKKNCRITSPTGMESAFDSEQLFWVLSKYLQ